MESLDPVALYFKEIRKTPPLDHKSFLKHFQKFVRGEKAQIRLDKMKNRLGDKSKKKLQETIQEGANSKIALVIGNLRLVIPVAKRFFRPGLDFLDLIEEGNIGLLHALRKFKPSKGLSLRSSRHKPQTSPCLTPGSSNLSIWPVSTPSASLMRTIDFSRLDTSSMVFHAPMGVDCATAVPTAKVAANANNKRFISTPKYPVISMLKTELRPYPSVA